MSPRDPREYLCRRPRAPRALALDAACAIELLHAGSLVHDDMPCFDNALIRRGLPTVHVAFGEPLARLTGDALLSLAFEVLSNCDPSVLPRAMRILYVLARSVRSCEGICTPTSRSDAASGRVGRQRDRSPPRYLRKPDPTPAVTLAALPACDQETVPQLSALPVGHRFRSTA